MRDWPSSQRAILHMDMDAFFASVEIRDDPSLRGKPVAVGGVGRRGVIATASYEARRYGVHSAQPTAQALQRCPQLILIPGRSGVYSAVSKQVMALLEEITPVVEVVGVDEAYLDVTGAIRLLGHPRVLAERLRQRVWDEVQLPCSVGGGISKSVAKIASARAKPAGLLVVEPQETVDFLAPLQISVIHGVGPVAAKKLQSVGVQTVGDLAELPPSTARRLLGSATPGLLALAAGVDHRAVGSGSKDKSIGVERTFESDITDHADLRALTITMADSVAHRARRKGFKGSAVAVKLRAPDGRTITRTLSLPNPTAASEEIRSRALAALERGLEEISSVRLLGVRAEHLVPADSAHEQASLDGLSESWGRIDQAMDAARQRFGSSSIARGTSLTVSEDARTVQGRAPEQRSRVKWEQRRRW